jgi:hypothetical protein
MPIRTILFLYVLTISLTLTQCSSAKKENQPPTDADQQQIEKEYQQNIDKLHDLTSGTKQTLDGKPVPKPTKSLARKTQP